MDADARGCGCRTALLACAVFAGVALRWAPAGPPLEGAAARQAHTASVARTFWREGIDLARPRVDDLPAPGIRVQGVPLYEAAVACLYRLRGGVDERLGRLLSAVLGIAAALLLYMAAAPSEGRAAAAIAAGILLASPACVHATRAVQTDGAALCASAAAYAAAMRAAASRGAAGNVAAALAGLAAALKVTMAPVFIPCAILAVRAAPAGGGRTLRGAARALLPMAVAALAATAWYGYVAWVSDRYPTRFADGDPGRWIRPDLWGAAAFWRGTLDLAAREALTPAVLGFSLAGWLLSPGRTASDPVRLWFVGGVAALALFAGHAMTHGYYHLAALPPAAILAGRGAVGVWRAAGAAGSRAAAGALLAAVAFGLPALIEGYRVPAWRLGIPAAGEVVRGLTPPDARIVAATREGGPLFLYACDRRGRGMQIPATGTSEGTWRDFLEERRREGCVVLAVGDPEAFEASGAFAAYCRGRLPRVAGTDDGCDLFRLAEGP